VSYIEVTVPQLPEKIEELGCVFQKWGVEVTYLW